MSTPTERLFDRMSDAHALAVAQASPDWLDRFTLRPKDEPLVLKHPALKYLHEECKIVDLASAMDWVSRYKPKTTTKQEAAQWPTRTLCWYVSWLVEVLEGRYEDDVPEQYGSNFYLRSRYGVKLYNHLWANWSPSPD